MKRILAGTDFSAEADKALQTAAAWARRAGAALRVVHVVPPRRWLVGAWQTSPRTVAAIQSRAMTALKERADALDPDRRLELSTGVVSGAASAELMRSARDFEADLLVVGTRGEHEVSSRHATLGGSAMKLLAAAPLPLLLVRTGTDDLPASVLAAVDLSPVSHDVLAAACASLRPGGTLTVFHAYEAPFADRLDAYGVAGSAIDVYIEGERQRHERDLEALVASLGTGAEARVVVERGNPIDPLFRQIEQLAPGLVVVGRGRGAARRAARGPGSVSRHVASFSPENVLVVPASAAKTLAAE